MATYAVLIKQYSKLNQGDKVANLVLPSNSYNLEGIVAELKRPGVYLLEMPSFESKILREFIEKVMPQKEISEETLKKLVLNVRDYFNLTEDERRTKNISLDEVLVERKASCFETAVSLHALFQQIGIDSYLTMGTRGINEQSYHAWVEVTYNGKRYIADPANIDRNKVVFEEKGKTPFIYSNLFHILLRDSKSLNFAQEVTAVV
ncbi:MAG: transglutaminase-like domain-containing protein [Candidatus Micrarchaeia archaeon]